MIWFYLNSLKFMKFMMSCPELVILSCLNPGDTKIVIFVKTERDMIF